MGTDPSFCLAVQDVFTLKGRGTVVTGRVESGAVKVGDEVYFKGQAGVDKALVTGLEASRKQIVQAQEGDTIGVLLGSVDKSGIQRGSVLAGTDSDSRLYF
jgi:elongation factor Tu